VVVEKSVLVLYFNITEVRNLKFVFILFLILLSVFCFNSYFMQFALLRPFLVVYIVVKNVADIFY